MASKLPAESPSGQQARGFYLASRRAGLALAGLALAGLSACSQHDELRHPPPPIAPNTAGLVDHFDCQNLATGLYWYGAGGVKAAATGADVPGFYDAAKPTLIFAHGWKPNAHKDEQLETFAFADPDTGSVDDLSAPWRAAGWNTGIFYWQQLADEDAVVDAERKIWSATDGVGMRWRRCDGSYAVDQAWGTKNVGDLYVDAISHGLQHFHGPSLRLVGHSLGSQLTLHGAQLIAAKVRSGALPPALMPTRVAQLDPWWSEQPSPHLATGAAVLAGAQELAAAGTAIEMYQTSPVLAAAGGDLNVAFFRLVGTNRQTPGFLRSQSLATEIGMRHAAAPALYWLSFASPPPPACALPCKDTARSAALSDEATLALMHAGAVFTQTAGMATATIRDDVYRREGSYDTSWSGTP